MSFDQGFDFRSTSGFVTDPSGCIFINGSATYLYPYTHPVDSNSVGWSTNPSAGDGGDRDRNSGIDARLAGLCYWEDYQDPITFRVDLPATGDYQIHLAFGDANYARGIQFYRIFDNASVLHTASALTGPGAGEFYDATDTKRTSAANWVSAETAATYSFSSTIFKLEIGDPAKSGTSSTSLAHLRIVQVAVATTKRLAAMGVG